MERGRENNKEEETQGARTGKEGKAGSQNNKEDKGGREEETKNNKEDGGGRETETKSNKEDEGGREEETKDNKQEEGGREEETKDEKQEEGGREAGGKEDKGGGEQADNKERVRLRQARFEIQGGSAWERKRAKNRMCALVQNEGHGVRTTFILHHCLSDHVNVLERESAPFRHKMRNCPRNVLASACDCSSK